MKILFGGALTIFIREEDFTKIDIDQNLISYTRPNGTQALIKFKYAIPGSNPDYLDHQDSSKPCPASKRQEKIPAAERESQSLNVDPKNSQIHRSNEVLTTLERKLRDLETKVQILDQSFNSPLLTQTFVLIDKKLQELEQTIKPTQTLKINEYLTLVKKLEERVTNLDEIQLPEVRDTWKLNEDKIDRTFAEAFARIEILNKKMNTTKAVETAGTALSNNPNTNSSEPT